MTNNISTLPPNWKVTPFQLLADFETGRTPPRANARYWTKDADEGIPWVSIGDMTAYGVVQKTEEKITPAAFKEIFRNRISRKGTLLMSFKLTIGRVATLGLDACHNEAIISIYPNNRVNQKYLEYFLSQVDYADYQDRAVKGHTLNQEKINRIQVIEPPKPQQEKIAAVLSKIRRAIVAEENLIATVRELKQSAMRDLFTRGLRGEPQKETEIGAVPESWRVGRLVEFAHFQRGFDITKKDQTQGTVPVVSSGGIKSWHDKAAAKGPGVVIGRKGTIGAVHYVKQDYWPHDTTLFATDFCGNVPLFVFYRLSVLDLKRLDSGAANPALNRNFLHEEVISWPKSDEQLEIAAILQTIDRKISVQQRKRTTLQELFKTMLHELMTGEIRVADLDIDVSEIKS